jgi:hypothetical protein
MSYQMPEYEPPPIPPKLVSARNFQELREGTKEYLQQTETFTRNHIVQLTNSHNRNAQAFGANVASAATMQVDGTLQQIVTGTAAIGQILPPAKFNGFKALYAADGFSLVTGGALPGAIASAITVPAGEAVLLMYFPPTETWGVIGAFVAGTLPTGSVGPAQLQAGAVTAPAIAAAAVTTPAIASAAITTAKFAANAVTYPASNLFSGSLIIDGFANPFDTWIDVPSTSIAININAQTDPVYVQYARSFSYTNNEEGDIIEDQLIDDLGNSYVNPMNNISAQASLQASGQIGALPVIENVAPPAGTYPATRTYHVQVRAHQVLPRPLGSGDLAVDFTTVKVWGWDSRA